MRSTLLLLIAVLFTAQIAHAQGITLKGVIQDPAGIPLEAATVYLRSAKDSTLVDYTITDSKGVWQMKSKAISQPVMLKVSYIGFAPYKQEVVAITADKDFGIIKLKEAGTELGEVVIEGEVPPVRVKKDTLEFDAASFKIRPDSNVQALLKQLPGVDIDPSGKITVNGKEVSQILVNGKPFFGRDGKVALQNLPADIIKKVQVSDLKTKKEELTGRTASSDNSSINFTIDKDKNKGVFGRITAGYGTNNRYEANGLINYFKDKRKISILASSNNINSSGFSNDDIFDSMGGGRNMMMWNNGDSSYINGVRIGGGTGITTTNAIGFNYADEWFKGFTPSANYFYTGTESKNNNRTRSEYFLTDAGGERTGGKQINNSTGTTRNLNFSHNATAEIDYKIDSTATVNFEPKFTRTAVKNTSSTALTTTNQDGELLNNNNSNSMSDSDNLNFTSRLTFNKTLNKKGRSVSAEFVNNNSDNKGAAYNTGTYNFYEYTPEGAPVITREDRNQLQRSHSTQDSFNLDLSYTEPVTDSLDVEIGTYYSRNRGVDNVGGFKYDGDANGYVVADTLTTYFNSLTNNVNPYTALHLNKSKLSADVTAGVNVFDYDNLGRYLGEEYDANKNYVLPQLRAQMRYRFSRGTRLSFNYNFNTSLPSSRQLLPVIDRTNPLSTITGNPDIDVAKSHRLSANFNKFDFATRSGFYLYLGAVINQSQIVSSVRFVEGGKRETTYRNINGGYSTNFSGNYNRSVKSQAGNNLRYSIGINASYNRDLGLTNGLLYAAQRLSGGPNVNLNYDLGEVLSINPSYSYSFAEVKYDNYSAKSASNFSHKAGLILTNYWPKHFVMGNDFSYTFNSQMAPGFRKDFFLWNTSVGYNFYKEQFLFKVKVYDLLNQNLGVSRNVTATGITDTENTVLKRYAMFSLTWKINNFGNKKGQGQGNGRQMRRNRMGV